jgi:hypothetical protein
MRQLFGNGMHASVAEAARAATSARPETPRPAAPRQKNLYRLPDGTVLDLPEHCTDRRERFTLADGTIVIAERVGDGSSALDLLRRVRTRIADPARWTTGSLAKRADGTPCMSTDERAARWDISGAVNLESIIDGANDIAGRTQANRLLLAAAKERGRASVDAATDAGTHADGLALVDRAIAIGQAAARAAAGGGS